MKFVVLHHTDWSGHGDHFDLMLQTHEGEHDDDRILMTFSTFSDEFPDGLNKNRMSLNPLHRRMYLGFEGRITEGRGTIDRMDQGELQSFENSHNEHLTFKLNGTLLKGLYRLTLTNGSEYIFEKVSSI